MAKNRDALRAGIFMVLSLAGTIAIVIGIAGSAQFTTRYALHLIGFSLADNVGGLRKGDDVRLGGLKQGSVQDIDYVRKDSRGQGHPAADQIVVTISLPEGYVLATNAKVGVETTLTGVTCLNITDLGTGSPLAADQILAGHPDALAEFMAGLPDLRFKLANDLDKVYAALDTYDKLGIDARGHIAAIAQRGKVALEDVHSWLGPSTTDFHQSMANIQAITGHIREKLPPVVTSIQEALGHLNATLSKAQGSMDDVKQVVVNARDLTAGLRSVVVRNQGRLDEIVTSVDKAAHNIDAATVEIRSSPWRLFWKPGADEIANLNLYSAARQFAEGAADLTDAAVALRDSLQESQPDPARVQKLYDNLNDQFKKFQQAEDDLWKRVRE
jgi:ABC-type transporter Mla subunit MlaD